jgi:NAD(P)-dependent dehydrogenase (short-subunit alcohol dehydrogenase family)
LLRRLASAGATTVLASRTPAQAQAVADEITAAWGCVSYPVVCDVTSEESVSSCVQEVLSRSGRLDILVNCAGINIRGPISELSLDQFREVQRTNVDGTWLACRAVVPHMVAAGYGRICNIASRSRSCGTRKPHSLHGQQRCRRPDDSAPWVLNWPKPV